MHNLFLIDGFLFSTMPEIHINGRFPYHNFSLETDDFKASYDTSSSLMVTGRSHNLTIAISTTTNTLESENSFCGIDFFIVFLCFALVIIIAGGIWLVRKRRIDNENSRKSGTQRVDTIGDSVSSQFHSKL